MAESLSTSFHIQAEWDRAIVPTEGGPAILVTEIRASKPIEAMIERLPIDIAFVLDRSGSMSGEPLEMVKLAVSVALNYLDDQDRVSLVSFDHGVRVWHDLQNATPAQKTLTRMAVDAITLPRTGRVFEQPSRTIPEGRHSEKGRHTDLPLR